MRHHCHCGFEKHLQNFRVKKFGVAGLVLMGLHVMFHVVECLVLPAVFVALGGRVVEEQAAAADESVIMSPVDMDNAPATRTSTGFLSFNESQRLPVSLRLEL